jgi:hypothetical protein
MRRLSLDPRRVRQVHGSAPRFDRFAERRIGRERQPSLLVERAETSATPIVHDAAHALERQVGQFGERLFEQHDVAG